MSLETGGLSGRKFRRKATIQELERISESYYYDIVVSSVEIKKLILQRIDIMDLDLGLVLREAGVTTHAFKTKYLSQVDPVSTPKLRQSHIESILNVLGIELKIQCVVEKDINKVRIEHLKKKR